MASISTVRSASFSSVADTLPTWRADRLEPAVPDPFRFDFGLPIAEFPAHAAEVVQGEKGELFLTSSGWTNIIGEGNRGLKIARLGWEPDSPGPRS